MRRRTRRSAPRAHTAGPPRNPPSCRSGTLFVSLSASRPLPLVLSPSALATRILLAFPLSLLRVLFRRGERLHLRQALGLVATHHSREARHPHTRHPRQAHPGHHHARHPPALSHLLLEALRHLAVLHARDLSEHSHVADALHHLAHEEKLLYELADRRLGRTRPLRDARNTSRFAHEGVRVVSFEPGEARDHRFDADE